MVALLESSSAVRNTLSGFLCPGHVSVIIGAEAYRSLVDRFKKPCVITGFEPTQMTEAVVRVLEQVRDSRAELDNAYRVAVTDTGNVAAQRLIDEVFEITTVRWRGLGTLVDSGLCIRRTLRAFDAGYVFGLQPRADHEPRACRCGEVITGRVRPDQCKLFANGCTPVQPVGPCMVSSEGTCQAWFKYHRSVVQRPRVSRQHSQTRLEEVHAG
jgi:hydrogenase expression/formation protein HypD